MWSLFAREFKLGIVVASVNYREIMIFGNMEAWRGLLFRKASKKFLFELFAVTWEHEAKWATEDNAVGMKGNGNRRETEQHAVDDVRPDFFFSNGGDEAAVGIV